MREIKFRGKRLDNGEWIEGQYVFNKEKAFIIYDDDVVETTSCGITDLITDRFFEVIPETVGQYTGLHDKNRVEIYENDIFKDYLGNIYVVSWYITKWALREKTKTGIIMHDFHNIGEVIGNVHDNPELLKEAK